MEVNMKTEKNEEKALINISKKGWRGIGIVFLVLFLVVTLNVIITAGERSTDEILRFVIISFLGIISLIVIRTGSTSDRNSRRHAIVKRIEIFLAVLVGIAVANIVHDVTYLVFDIFRSVSNW
jgi:cytochrome bd-type quinol oxidase subunit 2